MERILDNKGKEYLVELGTAFNPSTDEEVRKIINEHMHSRHTRLRFFYGYPSTGYDWMEEHDVIGYIGRSTGKIAIPLLIHNANSMGGAAILTDCILRIIRVGKNGPGSHKELYRHPKYELPRLFIRNTPGQAMWVCEVVRISREIPGQDHAVTRESVVARFKDEMQAVRWMAFMRGERMSK